jgi:hypothetical protein
MKKYSTVNKKKSQGIWLVEKRGSEEEIIDPILDKSWRELTSMDVYNLYNFGWRTVDICAKFKVRHSQVLERLRH